VGEIGKRSFARNCTSPPSGICPPPSIVSEPGARSGRSSARSPCPRAASCSTRTAAQWK
jgi:hypothetical protein